MSIERELLKECVLILDNPFNGTRAIQVAHRIKKLLAQREPLSDTKCPYPEETCGQYRDGFTDGILYAEKQHGIGVDNE